MSASLNASSEKSSPEFCATAALRFNHRPQRDLLSRFFAAWLVAISCLAVHGQTLVNVDFGAGAVSLKSGFAAAGQRTNDTWNLYSHYSPKFHAGRPLVFEGRLDQLAFADGSPSSASITVSNAPGVWGNSTGDPMLDSFIFAPNGSNLVATVSGLDPGSYHFHLYGWAEADVSPEQNPSFILRSGTNQFGPLTASGASGWESGKPWRERAQYIVFRDVLIEAGQPVTIEVVPSAGGIAVLNGLQILSRGTSAPRLMTARPLPEPGPITNLLFREIRYTGTVSPREARFTVTLDTESRTTNEISAVAFEGDLAILSPELPPGWTLLNEGRIFILRASVPGSHRLQFDLLARVTRGEPWNQIDFTGPPAAVASVSVQSSESNVELQILSGKPVEGGPDKQTLTGVLGADRRLALRWQGRTAESAREALLTVDSRITVSLTPAAIRYSSHFQYEILQARLSQIRLLLPNDQALTRVSGDYVKDWQIENHEDGQMLTVEFIRPIENAVSIALTTEQSLPALPSISDLRPPQPLGVQRETGSLGIVTEDLVARIDATDGLRQVNAAAGEFASFRFNGRPASLRLNLARVEPLLTASAGVSAQLEESRLTVRHDLNLNVARAGIYALEFALPDGFIVADLRGEGIDDWNVAEGKLRLGFAHRVLGDRAITVQLEQSLARTPEELVLLPLRPAGAAKETAWIGAGSVAGIQIKTVTHTGAREVPVNFLPNRKDELLAFRAEGGEWRITLSAERLIPRVHAQAFNLITIGDGLVGGSTTIRYSIVNQGVQQFRVRVPEHWRNIEFTGPNIRRKDQQENVWTIALQDKAWGGYTLVVTYDYSFDPQKAALDAAGSHPLDVERETGTIAITSAANMAIQPAPISDPLRQMDPSELASADRALISRPVLLGYRYEGTNFGLTLNVTRHAETMLLDAVADRAEITSVLTESGEMLTQASFLVKNNERQYQRLRLPPKAELWGVSVNGESVKAERDADWVMVSLPRGVDRNELFAVDLKYVEQFGALGEWRPRGLRLVAPETDVPGTYVEWELYTPFSKRVSGFGGNLTVARGTTHGFRDAWKEFVGYYRNLWHEFGAALIVVGGIGLFILSLVVYARKRGFQGVVKAVVLFSILALLAGMLLPALSKAKSRAQRISSVSNLKQIGIGARLFANDNEGRMPVSFEEMLADIGSERVLRDPETGQRYIYAGAGKSEADPDAILAYSVEKQSGREVLFADGSVQMMSEARFAEALAREAKALASMQAQAFQPRAPAPPAGRGPDQAQTAPMEPAFAPPAPPVATGIRSLRFDLPKSGRGYTFTRVLSLTSEPPLIEVSLMSNRAFVIGRMVFQVMVFLLGLGLIWTEWRRRQPRAWLIALGTGFVLVSVGSFLIAWRMLHLALILAVPGVVLLAALWLFWRWWNRRAERVEPAATPPPVPTIPPSAAAMLFVAFTVWNTPLEAAPENLKPGAAIVSAVLTGSAHERSAQFDATLELIAGASNQTLTLFGKEVAVREFSTEKGEARIWREGENIVVLFPEPGAVTIRLKLLVDVEGDATRRQLAFAIPPALGTRLTLTLAEPDAEVDFPGAISFRQRIEGGATIIEAVIGATNRLALSWTPRRKRAAEISATVFARQHALVTIGSGVVNTRSTIEWQVSQGELQQVQALLPQGHRLLKVSGPFLRTWDFDPDNPNLLTVELTKPVSPAVNLVLETEKQLDALPASTELHLPRALHVKRETGLVAVHPGEELGLTVERATGLERIDNAEFARAAGDEKLALFSAWRFLSPEFELGIRAETVQPRLEAVAHQELTAGLEQVGLNARFEFTISRAGLFAIRLVLPPEGFVEEVKCDGMQTWSEHEQDGQRILEIALQQRAIGRLNAQVRFTRSLASLPPQLALQGIHPLDADKLTIYITVAGEAGIGLKTASLTGLTEIPAGTVPGIKASGTGLLAFRHLASERPSGAAWQLVLDAEELESWVRAEIVNHASVGETLINGRSYVRYEIQNAPVKEFRLRVPPEWRNVEIFGSGVRRRDQADGEWRVELQSKVIGEYRLTVYWELPRTSASAQAIAGVEALGVERETGALGIVAQGQLQLVPRQATDELLRIDVRELPEWTGHRGNLPVLSYRYLRPGWNLQLGIQRFEEAALLQGLVDKVKLRTVIADDGQQMTQAELSIRNNGRQSLAVTLPKNADVWSAFVDGQPVRPARRGGHYLLPLERTGAEDSPIAVEFTFVGRVPFPRRSGKVELISPLFDLPLKDARWEVFLPPDFTFRKFRGSMSFESADLVPISQDFTLAEYMRQEQAKQEMFEEQAAGFLRRTKGELSRGNVDQSGRLLQFRGRAIRDESAARQLAELEVDISRSQSSNLLQAQNMYAIENARKFGIELKAEARAGETALGFNDVTVAEQQVAQLQRAQAVAVARVSPLRVNLPTRGVRYNFVQVLQTQVDKPLTITFKARNERSSGWITKTGSWAGALLLLWILAGICVLIRPRARQDY